MEYWRSINAEVSRGNWLAFVYCSDVDLHLLQVRLHENAFGHLALTGQAVLLLLCIQ